MFRTVLHISAFSIPPYFILTDLFEVHIVDEEEEEDGSPPRRLVRLYRVLRGSYMGAIGVSQ